MALVNPVDPQQQQASDNKADCESWTHSRQAPLSNVGIRPSDTPQQQPSVVVAVDTTKAVFSQSDSFAGHMITQTNIVGGVFNARNVVMTMSQDLVDLNEVDPQQQQAGCVSWIHSWQAPLSNTCVTTSDALPDQPAVAASGLSASLSKHMITQANSVGCVFNAVTEGQLASCAVENATAIDEANASTLRNYASGLAEALQSAACTPAMTLDNVAIVHAIALLLHIPPETVQIIIGRWTSNTSIGYQRYKAELMGGIASKLISTH